MWKKSQDLAGGGAGENQAARESVAVDNVGSPTDVSYLTSPWTGHESSAVEFRNTQRIQAKSTSLSQCWVTSLLGQALSAEDLWKTESSSLGGDADGSSVGEETASEPLGKQQGRWESDGCCRMQEVAVKRQFTSFLLRVFPTLVFPLQLLQSFSVINHMWEKPFKG